MVLLSYLNHFFLNENEYLNFISHTSISKITMTETLNYYYK